ncbi:MAG: hypothetical protein ABI867_11965 [Kofleriaceae bacterium]
MARGLAIGLGIVAVIAVIAFAVYGRAATQVIGHRFIYALDTTADPSVEPRPALDAWVQSIRNRLDEKETQSTVVVRDSQLVVEIEETDPDLVEVFAKVLAARASLAFYPVDATAAFATTLRERVLADRPPGITADVDTWIDPLTGQTVSEPYLRADDKDALVRYLRDVPVPAGRQIAYELVELANAQHPFWRTYLLETTPWLTGSSIVRARLTFAGSAPTVTIELTPGGTLRFAELTNANLGTKLAIVIEGRVRSAPIINSAIPNGEVVISMASGALVKQQIEADDLISGIQAGSLPAPLRLVTTERFEAERDDGIRWNILAILGLASVAITIVAVMRRR